MGNALVEDKGFVPRHWTAHNLPVTPVRHAYITSEFQFWGRTEVRELFGLGMTVKMKNSKL